MTAQSSEISPLLALMALLAAGFTIMVLLAVYSFKYLAGGWKLRALFDGFKRKMCMTLSLGAVFFSLYLFFVLLSAPWAAQFRSGLFFTLYRRPVECVYSGLGIFAFSSLGIYLVRMVVKYLYLTGGKDS